MKKFNIFYFPANKNYNPYNARMQEILSHSKATPKGLNFILKPKLLLGLLTGKKNIFILNWFEDYPFDTKGRVSPLKLVFFMSILLYAKTTGHIFYIKHNFTKHNLDNKYSKLYTFCQRLLEKNASEVFTHSNLVSENNNYSYIPHPLYRIVNAPIKSGKKYFLCFGMISRYKGYIELLESWHRDHPLLITGGCNDKELIFELMEKIKLNDLDVRIETEVLSDYELEATIKNSIAVLLPHIDNSCIVSGAAYLAFSLGSLTLVRDDTLLKNLAEPVLTKKLNTKNLNDLYISSATKTLEANVEERKKYAATKYSDSIIYEQFAKKIHSNIG